MCVCKCERETETEREKENERERREREYELVTLSPLKTADPTEWSHLLFKIAMTDLNNRCSRENSWYLEDTRHLPVRHWLPKQKSRSG